MHFRCALTQVIGCDGRSANTNTPRTSSSRHDYSCLLGDVVTSELHRAQPRRHLYRTSYSTPLSAPKGVISIYTRRANWVGRPILHSTTHLLLTTRLQLPWRRRHERAPPRAAATPPISYSTPMSAPKGALSMCTYPGNWVRRPVRQYQYTTHLLLTTRLQLPSWRRRHERAPPRAATTSPISYIVLDAPECA